MTAHRPPDTTSGDQANSIESGDLSQPPYYPKPSTRNQTRDTSNEKRQTRHAKRTTLPDALQSLRTRSNQASRPRSPSRGWPLPRDISRSERDCKSIRLERDLFSPCRWGKVSLAPGRRSRSLALVRGFSFGIKALGRGSRCAGYLPGCRLQQGRAPAGGCPRRGLAGGQHARRLDARRLHSRARISIRGLRACITWMGARVACIALKSSEICEQCRLRASTRKRSAESLSCPWSWSALASEEFLPFAGSGCRTRQNRVDRH